MKSKWFKALIILVFVVAVLLIVLGRLERNLEGLKDMPIARVDLLKVENGVHTGRYFAFPISAEVRVTVMDHVITGIDLIKHTTGQGKTAEVIPQRVVEAQSLEIDSVSGATYSSRVILKAIENALLSQATAPN